MELALPAEAATPPASPPFAKRAGHALLLHFPLLWRAHLHYAALAALVCWAACLAAAYLVPADPKHLWTKLQIDALQAALLLIVSMTAGAWARLQLRYPCPSQRFGVQLRLSALNVAILLAILSSLNTGSLIFARRMAPAVPKAEVDALGALPALLHQAPRCAWTADSDAQALLPTVKSVAERMGLEVKALSCESPFLPKRAKEADDRSAPVLVITDRHGAPMNRRFWETLMALQEQQRLVEQKALPWSAVTVSLALSVGAMVWIRCMPSAQRHRWRLGRPRWCHAPRVSFRAVAAYERYLLLHHPQAWAIETHRVVVRGGVAALLAATLSSVSADEFWLPYFIAGSAGGVIGLQLFRIFNRLCAFRLALHKGWVRVGLASTLLAFGLELSLALAFNRGHISVSDLVFLLLVIFGAPLYAAGMLSSVLPRMTAIAVWSASLAAAVLATALVEYVGWFGGVWVALALVCWVIRARCPAPLPLPLFALALFVVATFPLASVASMKGAYVLGLRFSDPTMLVLGWMVCFALVQGSYSMLARNVWAPSPK